MKTVVMITIRPTSPATMPPTGANGHGVNTPSNHTSTASTSRIDAK